jgi:hypothetical protein
MYCTHCGTTVPAHANFCPSCGTQIQVPEQGLGTTASIDLGTDQREHLEDLPPLSPGTGMLVVVRGPSTGARFLLDRDVVTIGRHPDADLFLDDVTVSRNHAEIHRTDAGPLVRDLGSLNGTYVSGSRVEEHVLTAGDELQVGRFKLVYVGADSA